MFGIPCNVFHGVGLSADGYAPTRRFLMLQPSSTTVLYPIANGIPLFLAVIASSAAVIGSAGAVGNAASVCGVVVVPGAPAAIVSRLTHGFIEGSRYSSILFGFASAECHGPAHLTRPNAKCETAMQTISVRDP